MKKYEQYRSNLDVLARADQQDLTNEFIVGGIIDKFVIQFELAWKVLKEILEYEGISTARSGSPRAILKEAFRVYSCIDEDVWLRMLSQRNNAMHIYNEEAAKALVEEIIREFVPAFVMLRESVDEQYGEMKGNEE